DLILPDPSALGPGPMLRSVTDAAPEQGIPLDALRHHGDAERIAGGVDFAVNVRGDGPPTWLRERLASRLDDLGAYPTGDVLLGGASEGFHLLSDLAARRGVRAAVVHPSFTEPEVELRRAGVTVHRTVLREPFRLDPDRVPSDADLVVVGNPTNPTSVLHPRRDVAALCRPGRVTVVDEAFLDVVDDEPGHTLAGSDLPGLVVLRSLTKTWALAGLRVGY